MATFLWGVATGCVGITLATLAIRGVPCTCQPSPLLTTLAGERDAARRERDELRERLAAVEGPFEVRGLTVSEDAARREQMRRRPVEVPEAERIPPAGVWVPGN